MPKPKDKTDAKIREEISRLDQFHGTDEQYKREEKRQLKKIRTRHDRLHSKRAVEKEIKDLTDLD